MPKRERTTTDPFGNKFLAVMLAKGMGQNFAEVAKVFGVKTPSVYDWVDYGRFSRDRYPQLVAWSGHPLNWWFDIPSNAAPGVAWPPGAVTSATRVREPALDDWPFRRISPASYARLPADKRDKIETFAEGVLEGWEPGPPAKRSGAREEVRPRVSVPPPPRSE